jgi:hypothetical protein
MRRRKLRRVCVRKVQIRPKRQNSLMLEAGQVQIGIRRIGRDRMKIRLLGRRNKKCQ